jgi:LPS-assembly lipoprotein
MLKKIIIIRNISILLIISLLLTACGFKLRGDIKLSKSLEPVYVQSTNELGNAVINDLREQGILVTNRRKQAKTVIYLRNAHIKRKVLTISAFANRLEEVELNYHVEIAIHKNDNKILIPNTNINLRREFTFNETEILAKDAEEIVLRHELKQDVLAQIMRIISTLNN